MTEQEFRTLLLYEMEQLAENGFRVRYRCDFPDARKEAFLFLQRGHKAEAQVCLTVGAAAKGDDHLVQVFYRFSPSMEEMAAWLRDAANADGLMDTLFRLGARVDEGFD